MDLPPPLPPSLFSPPHINMKETIGQHPIPSIRRLLGTGIPLTLSKSLRVLFIIHFRVLNLNVKGVFLLTRNFTPLLKKNATAEDPSRVINIGSVDGTAYQLL